MTSPKNERGNRLDATQALRLLMKKCEAASAKAHREEESDKSRAGIEYTPATLRSSYRQGRAEAFEQVAKDIEEYLLQISEAPKEKIMNAPHLSKPALKIIRHMLETGQQIHRSWHGSNYSGYLKHWINGLGTVRSNYVEELRKAKLVVAVKDMRVGSFYSLALAPDAKEKLAAL